MSERAGAARAGKPTRYRLAEAQAHSQLTNAVSMVIFLMQQTNAFDTNRDIIR